MTVRWVQQQDTLGCGVAVAAMVSGKAYAEVRALLPNTDWIHRWRGLTLPYMLDQLLTELGYALAPRWPTWVGTERREWPPEPWADVHVCMVVPAADGPAHFVVLLRDGSVLDPSTPDAKRLSDYHRVNAVAAVVPVGG